MEFANTVTIERPAQDVFAFLADFENVPTWNYAIVETRKTSQGPVGVGATYRQIRSVPARSEEEFEVTDFEPDTRLAIRGNLGPLEGTITYELEPAGAGTRLQTRLICRLMAWGSWRLHSRRAGFARP